MAVSVVSFSFSRAASTGGPGAQLSAECWLSLPHLVCNSNSSGAPRGPFGLAWLSLPHLISNFLSSQSYIIVQRPLNRPLNLWNGMFDRHQAEITVMQFRGHSLPVHQSMSVSWNFLPCPILSANFCPHDLFRLLAIGMCQFLLVHHFGNGKFGRVEGQNTTQPYEKNWVFLHFFY